MFLKWLCVFFFKKRKNYRTFKKNSSTKIHIWRERIWHLSFWEIQRIGAPYGGKMSLKSFTTYQNPQHPNSYFPLLLFFSRFLRSSKALQDFASNIQRSPSNLFNLSPRWNVSATKLGTFLYPLPYLSAMGF